MFSWIHLPITRRLAISVYTLCLAGLIGAYFLVSTMYVQHASYIQGTSRLTIGAPNALRGTLMNAQTGQRLRSVGSMAFRLLTPEQAQRADAQPDTPTTLGTVLSTPTLGPGNLFHTTVTPEPTLPPGPYVLQFEARIPGRPDLYQVRTPIELISPTPEIAAWPALSTRREDTKQRQRYGSISSTGPIRIDTLTHRPELSRGLPDTLFLRTYDAETGDPLSCEVSFDEVHGLTGGKPLPTKLTTNAQGLGRLRFAPLVTHTWTLSTMCGRDQPSTAKVSIASVASQSSLRPAAPGTITEPSARGSIYSLFESGGLLLDLYHQGRWVHASNFGLLPGRSGWSVPLEGLSHEQIRFYRVQVYQEFFGPGRAWDAHWLVAASPTHPDPNRAALIALLDRHLATHPDDLYFKSLSQNKERLASLNPTQVKRLVNALLDAAPTHFTRPETIINSSNQDQKDLDAWKQSTRAMLLDFISWAMTVGGAVLLLAVLRGMQEAERRRQLLVEIDLELIDTDQDISTEELARTARAAKLTRAVAIVQGVVVLGTIVFTAGTLLMLLKLL